MRDYLRLCVLFCSFIPVVLPCIYASELFLFDASKEIDGGIQKAVESVDKEKNIGEKMNLEKAGHIQQVSWPLLTMMVYFKHEQSLKTSEILTLSIIFLFISFLLGAGNHLFFFQIHNTNLSLIKIKPARSF